MVTARVPAPHLGDAVLRAAPGFSVISTQAVPEGPSAPRTSPCRSHSPGAAAFRVRAFPSRVTRTPASGATARVGLIRVLSSPGGSALLGVPSNPVPCGAVAPGRPFGPVTPDLGHLRSPGRGSHVPRVRPDRSLHSHTQPEGPQAPQDPRALRGVPDFGSGPCEGSESYLVTVDTPTAPVQRLGELRPPAFARAAGIRTRYSRTSGP